jgi:hypothetical protein
MTMQRPSSAGERARVVVQLPRERHAQLFTPESDARLRELADVVGRLDGAKARTLPPAVAGEHALFLSGGLSVPPGGGHGWLPLDATRR